MRRRKEPDSGTGPHGTDSSLRPGLPKRQTHDYKRHGTTTLFAAFNFLNGKVIGTCQDRHRSREFIRFLNYLEKQLALITGRMIRRGTFHSAEELEQAIYQWLAKWNGAPTPFVWMASADVILDKVRHCKELSNTGDWQPWPKTRGRAKLDQTSV